MRKRAEQAWRLRWGSLFSCTTARSVGCLCLNSLGPEALMATVHRPTMWNGISDMPVWTRSDSFVVPCAMFVICDLTRSSRVSVQKKSQTPWNFKVRKSTSKQKCVRRQRILRSQCNGSQKLRKHNFRDFEMLGAMIRLH